MTRRNASAWSVERGFCQSLWIATLLACGPKPPSDEPCERFCAKGLACGLEGTLEECIQGACVDEYQEAEDLGGEACVESYRDMHACMADLDCPAFEAEVDRITTPGIDPALLSCPGEYAAWWNTCFGPGPG